MRTNMVWVYWFSKGLLPLSPPSSTISTPLLPPFFPPSSFFFLSAHKWLPAYSYSSFLHSLFAPYFCFLIKWFLGTVIDWLWVYPVFCPRCRRDLDTSEAVTWRLVLGLEPWQPGVSEKVKGHEENGLTVVVWNAKRGGILPIRTENLPILKSRPFGLIWQTC